MAQHKRRHQVAGGRIIGPVEPMTEPAALLNPRALTDQEWRAFAIKAARLSIMQSAKGKERAKRGFHHGHDLTAANAARARAPRCTAATRSGARCRLPCCRGSDRCQVHEGPQRAPWSPAAARRYLKGTLRRASGRFTTHPSARPGGAQGAGLHP